MKAADVMTTPAITVTQDASIQDVATTLLTHRISAVPVVGPDGSLVGIVSEGDLVRRIETGTGRRRAWWLELVAGPDAAAEEFVREHSRRVGDVMTGDVVTASPDTPLGEIAALLERRHIKRVPIVDNGKVVGIVSRSNIVQALATFGRRLEPAATTDDAAIRDAILARFKAEPWAPSLLNVTVHEGVVDLWGLAASQTQKKAALLAAETVPGVVAVTDNLMLRPQVFDGYEYE